MPFLARNPAIAPLAMTDPHRYAGRARLGTAMQLKAAMEDLPARVASLSTPFLILHGTEDKITDCNGTDEPPTNTNTAYEYDSKSFFNNSYFSLLLCVSQSSFRAVLRSGMCT